MLPIPEIPQIQLFYRTLCKKYRRILMRFGRVFKWKRRNKFLSLEEISNI
jgi:hypothetical protein